LSYHLSGYRSEGKAVETSKAAPDQSSAAPAMPMTPVARKRSPVSPVPQTSTVVSSTETPPPPLAAPRPLPPGPVQPSGSPADRPQLLKPPVPVPDAGPELPPG
jgi:hypothetical protein